MRHGLGWLAFASLVPLAPVVGQGSNPCPFLYPDPQIGHFAEVEFSDPEEGRMTIRFAVIGDEKVEGREHYWIEVASSPPGAEGNVIAQMLVPGYPFEQKDIKGYIVKLPGKRAQRMPERMIEMMMSSAATPGPSWGETCGAAQEFARERITVAAGTFDSRHFRAGDADESEVWIADVPFGMVKMIQGRSQMQLLRYGSGAESSIAEEPEEIPMPNPPDLK